MHQYSVSSMHDRQSAGLSVQLFNFHIVIMYIVDGEELERPATNLERCIREIEDKLSWEDGRVSHNFHQKDE